MTTELEDKRNAVMAAAHHDFERVLNVHASFRVGSNAAGEDLVQATFLKTLDYLAKGGKIDIMKAFLYHILNNLIIDQYRKRKSASLDILLDGGFEPSVQDSGRLVNILDGRAAFLLFQHLPLACQEIMRMRFEQDLSFQEMSLITGKSRNAMAVQIHRGLGKLRLLHQPA